MFGEFTSHKPYELWELPLFLVIAVSGGLIGAAFNASGWDTARRRRRV